MLSSGGLDSSISRCISMPNSRDASRCIPSILFRHLAMFSVLNNHGNANPEPKIVVRGAAAGQFRGWERKEGTARQSAVEMRLAFQLTLAALPV